MVVFNLSKDSPSLDIIRRDETFVEHLVDMIITRAKINGKGYKQYERNDYTHFSSGDGCAD